MVSRPVELVVFADDWGAHPSSCQHLVQALLSKYRVHWVNTIGTRIPSFNVYSIKRGCGKLVKWVAPGSAKGCSSVSNPRVLNPLMWPSFRSRLERWANRRLLTWALERSLPRDSRLVAVTTIPLVADLVGRLPVERWVYYCVDDLAEWPGLDKAALEQMEGRLLEKVDDVIAVSEKLVRRMHASGRFAHLLTHGVDLEHWHCKNGTTCGYLERFSRPLVVFWGLIDKRLDGSWLCRLSQRMVEGTILLVGPENEPDRSLKELANVRRVGPVPYTQLPSVAAAASVLIMPYADLPATRAMQPLKLKEYLATGKPVVTSDLPAVAEWQDAADVAKSADEFADSVLTRLESGLPTEQKAARQRLIQESWRSKANVFEAQLLGYRL